MQINGYEIKPGANLEGAYLAGANLWNANLRSANLRGANLRDADLRGADLRGANLEGANLEGADLEGANLEGADLRGADLEGADLEGADLEGANLRDANLMGANLMGAYLEGAKNVPFIPQITYICEGDIIGWKKTTAGIVKLLIPAAAKRSNGTTRKCRAEWAVVLEAPDNAYSLHDPAFIYRVGTTVRPTNGWCEDRWNACAPGIHFFLTREEAEAYV